VAKREIQPVGPEDLAKLGQVLFGAQWKRELVQALELSSVRLVTQWVQGEKKIPRDLWGDMFELARLHEYDLDRLLADIERRLPRDP
jgi:hypothetical protein